MPDEEVTLSEKEIKIISQEKGISDIAYILDGDYIDEEYREENKDVTIAVLGAGHGGQAMAAHLALKGFRVNLFNRTYEHIIPITRLGGIEVKGAVRGFGRLNKVTSDMKEAVSDAQLIMVVVPAFGHRWMAERCAPHLKKDQVILLNPGRTLGALEFYNVLKKYRKEKIVTVLEAETFIYASRRTAPGQTKIFRIKSAVAVAAMPAFKTKGALPLLQQAFPQFVPAENILETSLNNMACVFHPPITLLNAARIENTQGDFQYYIEGTSPAMGRILEEIDHERINLVKKLKVRPVTAHKWLKISYSSEGRTLVEAIQNNAAYRGIYSPRTVFHRYLLEDVPMSMVPMASIARMLNIACPCLESVINLCSVLTGRDFWKLGRTTKTLKLEGLTSARIRRLVEEGR